MFDTTQSTYLRMRQAYAERRKPFCFWVGAGLSQPSGLPNWAELRDRLVAEALEGLASLPSSEADRLESQITTASVSGNLWKAFTSLRQSMNEGSYFAAIRQIFSSADDIDPPENYSALWKLSNVLGLVTLNIDKFADRSHSISRPGESVASFVGRDAHTYAHLIGSQRPFIANLHGVHQSTGTWIFTQNELDSLYTDRYRTFLTALFGATTVVFVGISAEDQAAGGFLSEIAKSQIDLGDHYWVTSRRDAAASSWASEARVQVVRYAAESQREHQEAVNLLAADLEASKSRDGPAKVVLPQTDGRSAELEVRQLRMLDDDDLRTTLSSYAKRILDESGGATDSDSYREFVSSYHPAIHQAWHVTDRPPFNKFFGREVLARVSAGPFSTVWRVSGDEEGDFALKVLMIDNLDKGPSIDSFRRGVECLTYLTAADIPGTAKLVSASEIPTAVLMRFVEGSNLSDVICGSGLDFWSESIPVILAVCQHLKFGHNLPQGVLHRDVRPSNVMLPYIYWEESTALDAGLSKYEAVLINYDMSWHANACGGTIPGNLAEAGYYAPEQLNPEHSMSRSTLVDSYGLGMSIYFCFTRQHPPTGGSRSSDWQALLASKFRPSSLLPWRSAPERLRRLICKATEPNAQDRWSVSRIEAELEILHRLHEGLWKNLPADIWAEELVSRVTERDYETNNDASKFGLELRQGRTIEVYGDLTERTVELRFRNMGITGSDWTGADRVWKDKLDRARDMLNSAGWSIESSTRYTHMDILLHVSLPIVELESKFSRFVETLKRALDQVRLD